MPSRLLPDFSAETLHLDSHLKLRESLDALNINRQLQRLDVNAAIRRTVPPRIAPTLPKIPHLKGLVRR